MAKPIPQGQHNVVPHLTIRNGACAKAIEFYKSAFGAEENFPPMKMPDGKVMHAALKIGDAHIYLADEMGPPGGPPNGVSIHLWCTDVDATWARATKAGATVKMPLANMFWGDRYGQLTDPFGHSWSLGTHIEDVPPQEMGKRAQEAMAKMRQ
jgi:uncharacterized glyoxalase superfamily protein PhnB